MTGERRKWKNIIWPNKLQKRTRLFIEKYPILNKSFTTKWESKCGITWQNFELQVEIAAIEWTEQRRCLQPYNPLSETDYAYKKDLLQAIEQLTKLKAEYEVQEHILAKQTLSKDKILHRKEPYFKRNLSRLREKRGNHMASLPSMQRNF
jgi:hypothetical protein